MGFNIPFTGNHVPNTILANSTGDRVDGNGRGDLGTMPAVSQAEITSLTTATHLSVYNCTKNNDSYYTTSQAAWDSHFQGIVNTGVSLGCVNYQVRNEPNNSAFTRAEIQTEQQYTYGIIKAAQATAKVWGPTALQLGFTANRNAQWLSSYIASGTLAYNDVFDFHTYQGTSGPEVNWCNEVYYVVSAVLASSPTKPIAITEFGGQTGTSGAQLYWGTSQGRYQARSFMIYRCVPNIVYANCYSWKDGSTPGAGDAYGVWDNTNSPKASWQYVKDVLGHIQLFVSAAAYTRTSVSISNHNVSFPATDDLFGGDTSTCTWFVRGTQSDGSHRLAGWDAANGSISESVIVNCATPAGGTLKKHVIGGSTTTLATLVPGVQRVSLTLTGDMQVLYSDDAYVKFPEFIS